MLDNVFGARLKCHFHQLILGRLPFLDEDHALGMKSKRNGPGLGHVATVLLEGVPDDRGGSLHVFSQAINKNGHAASSVAFIANVLIGRPVSSFTTGLLDGLLDGVLGHVDALGVFNGVPQPEVRVRIGIALLHCRHDRAARLAPGPALDCILPRLAMLDVRPLAVTGHVGILLTSQSASFSLTSSLDRRRGALSWNSRSYRAREGIR